MCGRWPTSRWGRREPIPGCLQESESVEAEVEAEIEVGFVVVSRLERYRVFAGYGGWDDEMPWLMDSGKATERVITCIGPRSSPE
jgi:hypothetical protein